MTKQWMYITVHATIYTQLGIHPFYYFFCFMTHELVHHLASKSCHIESPAILNYHLINKQSPQFTVEIDKTSTGIEWLKRGRENMVHSECFETIFHSSHEKGVFAQDSLAICEAQC